jgi:hypothetical protein
MPHRNDEAQICRACGAPNDTANPHCFRCGTPLSPDDYSEEDDSDEPATTDADHESAPRRPPTSEGLTYSQIATAGAWFLFGPVIAAGVITMMVGILQDDAVAVLFVTGAGAVLAWIGVKMLKAALVSHRPVADHYPDEPADDEEDADDSWRIPGYGTDAEERAAEERAAEERAGDDSSIEESADDDRPEGEQPADGRPPWAS